MSFNLWVFSKHLLAARCLPRDGDPVAADSCVEHRDPPIQPGTVHRGREVVWPRHELPPPPGNPAGELRETGSTQGFKIVHSNDNSLQVFRNSSLSVHVCADVCALWRSTEQVGQNQEEPHGNVKWSHSAVAAFLTALHCCSFAFSVVVLRRSIEYLSSVH